MRQVFALTNKAKQHRIQFWDGVPYGNTSYVFIFEYRISQRQGFMRPVALHFAADSISRVFCASPEMVCGKFVYTILRAGFFNVTVLPRWLYAGICVYLPVPQYFELLKEVILFFKSQLNMILYSS